MKTASASRGLRSSKGVRLYHVSADYLLGRTLDRDGGMIDAESLYDSSDEKGTLRGSIAATLQKKMLVNTAGVLFELLGKTNDRTLITSAGSYLGGAFYQLYRALHRASGGKEGYFGLDATATSPAQWTRRCARTTSPTPPRSRSFPKRTARSPLWRMKRSRPSTPASCRA